MLPVLITLYNSKTFTMAHDHSHGHHHHSPEVTNINTAFIIGIGLNTLFVIIEFLVGYTRDSLALISDAGHNATDVFSLLISLFAFRLMKSKASSQYTYGYKKGSILASLLNAVLLLLTVIFILYEGIQRIQQPVPVQGTIISIVALIGVAINGFTAYLFFKDQKKDINIKGAYLHMVSDAVVSVGVVIGGILINYTGWYWLDTVLSFLIGLIILKATWGLFTESIKLSMDGTPANIQIEEIRKLILQFPQIKDVHHIHVWPLSSSENALTAHLVLTNAQLQDYENIKNELKDLLFDHHIHHVTFELESNADNQPDCNCMESTVN